jgi:phosphoenolpyruvate carboxykinase (ATP)
MLSERISKHGTRVFLVNTGWTGGPFGTGHRMDLEHTRAMIKAALAGQLDDVETWKHPIFNLDVPKSCPNVPGEILDPQSTWDDKDAYEVKAKELANMFADNFERFSSAVAPEITKAGPAAD